MKKILALLIAAMMLIGLAACGGNDNAPTTTEAPATEGNDPAPTGGDEPATEETTLPAADLTVHENTFFTVGYDEADGWTLAEDDIYMSEYGGDVYLRILDDEGYTDVFAQITAYQEDAPDFRETLHANGVELKAYAEGTWPTESIGGLQMAAVEKEDNEWYFFDRNVEAGISY